MPPKSSSAPFSPPHLSELSFEQALTRLQDIVAQLEGGALTLEATVTMFREGSELASHCQQMIADAELRITTLAGSAEGVEAPEWVDSTANVTPQIPGL